MALPAPSQFQALIPAPADSLGLAMVKFMKFVLLWTQAYAQLFDSTGALSDTFKHQLCTVRGNCGS